MSFSLKQSFDDHSQSYSSRVTDRKKYANLSVEDRIIVSFLEKNLPKDKKGILLDAACGSGDRLRMLFDTFHLSKGSFKKVIGIDYTQGMLDIAATQKYNAYPLYDHLKQQDLLEDLSSVERADVILCLWEVTNSIGIDSQKAVRNLADRLNERGYLIYDMVTTKASNVLTLLEAQLLAADHELKKNPDPQQVWYKRDDDSVGYLRMFSPAELNELLASSGLKTCAVWGYRHTELVPSQLSVTNGRVDENQAAEFSGILVIQQAAA